MRDGVAVAALSRLQRSLRRELWLGIGLAALLAGLAFALALRFVEPAPPRHVVLSTGPADSGYHGFALRYREALARDGVTLELRTSQGSPDNVGRLMDADAIVDAGFLQGGTSYAANAPDLVSLGSLYYEPLWVFYRGREIDDLTGLRGRKVAIGPDFSGVRALALQLLAVNDVVLPPTELLPLAGEDAANALLAQRVDAAMFVAPAPAAIPGETIVRAPRPGSLRPSRDRRGSDGVRSNVPEGRDLQAAAVAAPPQRPRNCASGRRRLCDGGAAES
jgi:TRAP-type uncharacterized transport system substrate-binding protein